MFIFRKINMKSRGLLWFGSDFQKINWRSQEVLNLDSTNQNPILILIFSDFDFPNTVNTGPNDLTVHPLGVFIFIFFIFLVRKIPFAGIELTSQRVRRLHGYL